jgi:hypothetical protein
MEIYAVYVQDEVTSYQFDNYSHFGFFYKSHIKEIADEYIRIITTRVNQLSLNSLNQFDDIGITDLALYIYHMEKSNIYIVCSHNITKMMIMNLLIQFIKLSSEESRNQLLMEFNQEPQKFASRIDEIHQQQNQIKEVLMGNIEKLLERGESMEYLLQKSERLNESSNNFYIRAKKTNSCCNLF